MAQNDLDTTVASVLEGPMWEVSASIRRAPRPPGSDGDSLVSTLVEESTVRDRIAMFSSALDSQDLDAVLSFFTEDAVLVNPRGTFAGREAIRANYDALLSSSRAKLHLTSNVVARLTAPGQAVASSYYFSILDIQDTEHAAPSGTYLDRWERRSGEWCIRERRITVCFQHALVPKPFVAAASPDASSPETSVDLEH